ncbi:hypothetical protein HPB49_015733 [Dermacentor silvarum]|uniref:Uncharacterized protein n=1 Tax=Dermacentor silvarum TaxID=543639 RepID=A0ACB8DP64_DERSI|nr:hypothetical protein HPB49_015733 [Dermacentor silvarum]
MASQKARLQNTAAGRAILHRTGTATELRALDGQRSLPPQALAFRQWSNSAPSAASSGGPSPNSISDSLVSDEATPVQVLHQHLELVLTEQAELLELDRAIQDTLTDADVEADLTTAFDRVHRSFLVLPRNLPRYCTQRPLPSRPECRRRQSFYAFPCQTCTSRAFWGSDATGKLFGTTKTAIQGIRLAEANYRVAVKVLSDRFSRRDMLVDDHLDRLLEMAPIRSSADLDKLRDLYDEITFHTSALEGLGVSPDEYAAVL